VSDLFIHKDKSEIKAGGSDWDSTLYKRGFEQIILKFLDAVKSNSVHSIPYEDTLLTHKMCEEVV
jgi:virulence factor